MDRLQILSARVSSLPLLLRSNHSPLLVHLLLQNPFLPTTTTSSRRSNSRRSSKPHDFSAAQGSATGGSAYGSTVEFKFCASCSYRGTAVTMKKMLEASFPGIDVIFKSPSYSSKAPT